MPGTIPLPARVLVAEDEPGVREFITRSLTHAGHTVKAVGDGQQALDVLAVDPPFDLLVTDIVMPHLDGIGLALKAAQDYPAMRIVMISGYATERQRAYHLDALVHRVIAKPFSLQEICAAVQQALTEEKAS
jgi:two-component system, cell cycle response regulator CpdR